MNLSPRTVATLIRLLVVSTSAVAPQSGPRSLDLTKVQDVAVSSCTDQDRRQSLDSPSTDSLLAYYGINIRDGIWTCHSLQAQWLRNGKVLSLRTISAQVDTSENVTLLSVVHEPHLWVVPVSSGMVGYSNAPDEIHNRAAFNALLADNPASISTPESWLSRAIFYMNMVGIETHVADWKTHNETVHGLESSPDFFHKKSLQPAVECDDDTCSVTVYDTRTTSVTKTLTVWVLSFTKIENRVRLDSVEHEVKPLSELP